MGGAAGLGVTEGRQEGMWASWWHQDPLEDPDPSVPKTPWRTQDPLEDPGLSVPKTPWRTQDPLEDPNPSVPKTPWRTQDPLEDPGPLGGPRSRCPHSPMGRRDPTPPGPQRPSGEDLIIPVSPFPPLHSQVSPNQDGPPLSLEPNEGPRSGCPQGPLGGDNGGGGGVPNVQPGGDSAQKGVWGGGGQTSG